MHLAPDLAARHLELLRLTLTHHLWEDELAPLEPAAHKTGWRRAAWSLLRAAGSALSSLSGGKLVLARRYPYDRAAREVGRGWPPLAHTMIGLRRMENLQHCVETVLREGVPGDLIETGVWRGGAVIFMRAILAAYGVTDRRVWVADSFEGIPPPSGGKYPKDAGSDLHTWNDILGVSLPRVQENFRRFGLLDEQVRFLPGWFRDTLPTAPVERLAVLRLDGDLYESTHDALTHLFPKVSPGGFVIVDDYFMKECSGAVDDYRSRHGLTEPLERIDDFAVFWRVRPRPSA